MNLVITSEHRVGSRWLHYLLADILDMGVSPERDGFNIPDTAEEVYNFMRENRIVKYHHATPHGLFDELKQLPFTTIGVVRNPRDRSVSKAFHDFYHPKHDYQVKHEAETDRKAVRYIVLNSGVFDQDNYRQINDLMLDGLSTRSSEGKRHTTDYIWTSYEWLLEDTYREVKSILELLGRKVPDEILNGFIEKHSFKNKSGRDQGEEDRADNWRRKGIIGDWIHWYDNDMLMHTAGVQESYWMTLFRNNEI